MAEPKVIVEEVYWEQINNKELMKERELCQIIDELAPGKNLPLLKISYPYGSIIADNGLFFLPTSDGSTVAITDSSVPIKLQKQLGYQSLPLALNSGTSGVEVYRELEEGVFSLAYFEAGLNLGIWETLESSSTPCRVSAGARSIFVLPKITDAIGRKRLKQQFGIRSSVPSKPFEQWHLFTELANHPEFPQSWSCQMFFFTDKWMEKIRSGDKAWLKLYNFILKRAWKHTEYGRNKIMLDMIWESFSRSLTNQRVKLNSYLADILKQLAFIATGALPAFVPAINNKGAPIDGFMNILSDTYGLKNYFPSMLQPHHFHMDTDKAVYYSLQASSYLESIPRARNPGSARGELAELILLIDQFISHFLNNQTQNAAIQGMQALFRNIKFTCFHSDAMKAAEIYPSNSLPQEDKRFLYMPKGIDTKTRIFCEKSSFVRGCIRVSRK